MKRVILLLVLTLVFSQVAYSAVGFNYNEIEELPYPIRDAGSTVLNGKLYVIGGISSNNNILNSTIIIDLKTLKWTFGPSLPIPLYAPLVITYNNTIYVIGGVTVNNTINKYVLKLVGNYWSIVSTLPTPVYYAIGFGWNDKIYVIGGFTKLSSGVGIIGGAVSMTDLVQIYDLRSGSWTTSNAPIKVAEAGYTFNGTHLIIVGGYVGLAQFSSSVYIYNPSTNNWTELPSLPVDIFSEAVAYYHKVILVVEGISSSIYEPIGGNFKVYAFYEGKWYVIGNVSESFYSFAYSQDGNTLYIIGGINWATSQISDKILTFKILTPPLQPIIQQVRIMNHSVYLSWSCQNASYYKVEYWSENGNLSSIITTQNFTVISNLSNGIRYYFRIIPYNQFGEGDPSNIVSAVPGTVPLPPKIISIIPGNQNLTINWSPTSDEGYPIIGYYLGISENESKNIRWFYVGNVTSYTVTNLTAGNKYIIYLIARNELGNSTPAIGYGVPQALPRIISLNYSSMNNSLLTVSWKTSYNANYTIKIYDINYNLIYQTNTSNTTIKISIPYGNYTLILISKNNAGTITYSEKIVHYIPPQSPIVSLGITQNLLTIAWSSVPYATYYEVFLDGNLIAKTSSTQAQTIIDSFGNHTVIVIAYNPAGSSKPTIIQFSYNKPTIAKITGSILLQQNLIAVANVQQSQSSNVGSSNSQGLSNSTYLILVILLIVLLSFLVYLARKV